MAAELEKVAQNDRSAGSTAAAATSVAEIPAPAPPDKPFEKNVSVETEAGTGGVEGPVPAPEDATSDVKTKEAGDDVSAPVLAEPAKSGDGETEPGAAAAEKTVNVGESGDTEPEKGAPTPAELADVTEAKTSAAEAAATGGEASEATKSAVEVPSGPEPIADQLAVDAKRAENQDTEMKEETSLPPSTTVAPDFVAAEEGKAGVKRNAEEVEEAEKSAEGSSSKKVKTVASEEADENPQEVTPASPTALAEEDKDKNGSTAAIATDTVITPPATQPNGNANGNVEAPDAGKEQQSPPSSAGKKGGRGRKQAPVAVPVGRTLRKTRSQGPADA
ncbi:hypothetical protein VTJ83DRAFT_4693 [Remersonia thermophila]|uniref:Uncharacterized protein n=1 Tax=Remersonia thermophila TaxID=72144 RepID=A0ABR4DAP0_9PEZI